MTDGRGGKEIYLAVINRLRELFENGEISAESVDGRMILEISHLVDDEIIDQDMDETQAQAVAIFAQELLESKEERVADFQLGFQYGYSYARRYGNPKERKPIDGQITT